MFYQSETGMNPSAISRDEKWIALGKPNTTSDRDVYLYNTETRESKHITPHKEAASYAAATFDPESKRLFIVTNAAGEFAAVRTYDLASGEMKDHEKADWDIVGTGFSRDGKVRISAVNQDGSIVVRMVEGPGEKPVTLPSVPGGEMRQTAISPRARPAR
jgi:hypothetical protein